MRSLNVGQETRIIPDMEQQTGSKLRKDYIKAIYCCPVYLTYMQNTSCEMPGINIAGKNINNLRYADNTTLMAESEEERESILMRVIEESVKLI